MNRRTTLVLTHKLAGLLRLHLFPSDGLEAAALLLCAVVGERRTRLLARECIPVPHDRCARTRDSIVWPGEFAEAAIDRAAVLGDVVIAVHSHPGGLYAFSHTDDESDRTLMSALLQGTDRLAGSAIMIPSGAMRARLYENDNAARPIDLVMVAGPDIQLCWNDGATAAGPGAPAMAFTSEMRAWLGRVSVCVIGVSGTGSIVAEQLARLGIGEIILIDFDRLEERISTASLIRHARISAPTRSRCLQARYGATGPIAKRYRCRRLLLREKRSWLPAKQTCFSHASTLPRAVTSRIV